ncbi:MAG: hypothetical protein RBU37_17140 [Myxococcota bacterium]|jgi:hypothetical protein|nr:hypothetical protein [Myxococcota bacterium]
MFMFERPRPQAKLRNLAFALSLLLLTNGACHLVGSGGWLGDLVDAEDSVDVSEQADWSQQDLTQEDDDGLATWGERCEDRRCAEDLLCLDYPNGSFCSQSCEPSEPFCSDASRCVGLQGMEGGVCLAFGTGGIDSPCESGMDCAKTMACVSSDNGQGVCTPVCDFTESIAVCPSGYGCTISTAGVDYGLCVPLGG